MKQPAPLAEAPTCPVLLKKRRLCAIYDASPPEIEKMLRTGRIPPPIMLETHLNRADGPWRRSSAMCVTFWRRQFDALHLVRKAPSLERPHTLHSLFAEASRGRAESSIET